MQPLDYWVSLPRLPFPGCGHRDVALSDSGAGVAQVLSTANFVGTKPGSQLFTRRWAGDVVGRGLLPVARQQRVTGQPIRCQIDVAAAAGHDVCPMHAKYH